MEGLDGLSPQLFEGDGDERPDARRGAVIIPGESEDEPPIRDDLAVDAAEPVVAMLR